MEGSREALLGWAHDQLAAARAEAADGYITGDAVKVRKSAERAWKAACAATDAAMEARGLPRDGTGTDRARHYEFLDTMEPRELAWRYALFADRLHTMCAHLGHLPSEAAMKRHFDEVEGYILALAAGK